MLSVGLKAEIQALFSLSFSFLAHEYLTGKTEAWKQRMREMMHDKGAGSDHAFVQEVVE